MIAKLIFYSVNRLAVASLVLSVALPFLAGDQPLFAEDDLEPGDPFAAIDGDPIYLGELNLILTERFKTRDLESLGPELQQATAALLVKRHLAMRTLRAQGGDLLQGMIEREIERFAAEAKRRGSSMAEQAAGRLSDEKSLKADLAWRIAWGSYLKSRITLQNLRRFYETRRNIYGGNRYEVSQVFVKLDMSDEVSVSAAEANLRTLLEDLRDAESTEIAFAEAARQHSDAPTAAEGGLLGLVEKDGDLPGSVMTVVRNTPVGQIGGPIRSPLGLHLIYVHQMKPGNRSFDDLKDQAQLRRDAADALFDQLVEAQSGVEVVWLIRSLKPPSTASDAR